MTMTYRHSDGAGGHSFYPDVVGDPDWDEAANTLTLTFADGETRTFGPSEEAGKITYGRILYRDENFGPGDSDNVLFNCTFWPLP
jgi:hypothetical protein